MVRIIINILIAFSVSVAVSVTLLLSLKGKRLQVLLKILRLGQLASLPELNDEVSVLTDLSLGLEGIVPLFRCLAAEIFTYLYVSSNV